jgi:hypothetical protein
MNRLRLAAGALVLVACGAAAFAPAPKRAASIQELMAGVIDPAADRIWDAVSSETGPHGVEEHFPRTAQEWAALRRQALDIVAAANLLQAGGLPVSHGQPLEDADVPGISTAPQIRHAIDADPRAFAAHARQLHTAGRDILAAIDARSPQRLLIAGERLDAACERCHAAYWYPNAEQQPAWPAPLKH